jgi:hypothetical protein
MMINVGATLPKDQLEVVIRYLATHFPEKPEAVVMPGSMKVSIQEWTVPTPGSRPHDPLVAPDGSLVRFDPKTETLQTWVIPSGGGVVRNMDVTRDGNLALACSGVNGMALVQGQ